MNLVRAAGSFEQSKAIVLNDAIEFGGHTWKPNRSLAYVVAELCHTWPARNKNGHSITAATLANSVSHARNQLMDFEHRLAYYAQAGEGSVKSRGFRTQARAATVRDRICGTIAAIEFPTKEAAVAAAKDGKAVPFRILVAVYRRAEGANEMLIDLVRDGASWKTSMEWEFSMASSALWNGEKAVAWKDVPEDVKKSAVKDGAVLSFSDPDTLLCGGMDGEVFITGGAFTRTPADENAGVMQLAASIRINTGWKSQDDWCEAVARRVSLRPEPWMAADAPDKFFAFIPLKAKGKRGDKSLRALPLASIDTRDLDGEVIRSSAETMKSMRLPANARKSVRLAVEAAAKAWNAKNSDDQIKDVKLVAVKSAPLVVGKTDESEGHSHEIFMDLSLREANGHTHWIKFNYFDLNTGIIQGITAPNGRWVTDSAGERWIEHTHTFRLQKSARADTGATQQQQEVPTMAKNAKELAARLRTWAATMEEGSGEQKDMLAEAAQLESQDANQTIASEIETKVKAGELVTKEAHEKAVADAKKAGGDEIRQQVEAEKAKAEADDKALTKRIEQVTAAKINPDMPLGKDRTIKTVVASIPADEAGDKVFAERLEEWKAFATASSTTNATASTQKKPGTPPITVPGDHTNPANKQTKDVLARARKA